MLFFDLYFSNRREFFQKKLEILDLIVMTAGLVVNIVVIATYNGQGDKKTQAAKYVEILSRIFLMFILVLL